MPTLNVPTLRTNDFCLSAIEAREPAAKFSGTGDIDAVAQLKHFLEALHQELVRTSANTVAFDLNELYFMNSSCLKAFVSWIHKVNTGGRPYTIHFITNQRLQWQAKSVATLQRFAPSVVSLEERS